MHGKETFEGQKLKCVALTVKLGFTGICFVSAPSTLFISSEFYKATQKYECLKIEFLKNDFIHELNGLH